MILDMHALRLRLNALDGRYNLYWSVEGPRPAKKKQWEGHELEQAEHLRFALYLLHMEVHASFHSFIMISNLLLQVKNASHCHILDGHHRTDPRQQQVQN